MTREDDAGSETTDEHTADDTLPTWGDLFTRGEAIGATESEIRERLRSRRDA